MHFATGLLVLSGLLFGAYWLVWIVYTLYFHPLSRYPGPAFAAISNIWYARGWMSGRWLDIIQEAHATYGDVVRIGPNDLSFISAQALRDVYGPPGKGRKYFPKAEVFWKTFDAPGMTHILDPEEAAAARNMLSPGFSPQALRAQEHLILEYTDLFLSTIDRIGVREKKAVDFTDAFNWLTFDILGELAFGESFDAVKNAKTHFWTSLILEANFAQHLPSLLHRLPLLGLVSPLLISKKDRAIYVLHRKLTEEKTQRRVRRGDRARQDFFSHVLRRGGEQLTDEQLASHASILIMAGAETISTTLTAAVTFLAQNPRCLRRLQAEVRSAFATTRDITGESTAQLRYLRAVIEESLRCFPAVPVGLGRESPGETVDGHYVPKGVMVLADMRLAALDPRNFVDPHAFLPERWIDGKHAMDRRLTNLAFNLGPRGCLGLNMAHVEMRIVLSKLVLAYDWALLNPDLDLVRDSRFFNLWKKPQVLVRLTPAGRDTPV